MKSDLDKVNVATEASNALCVHLRLVTLNLALSTGRITPVLHHLRKVNCVHESGDHDLALVDRRGHVRSITRVDALLVLFFNFLADTGVKEPPAVAALVVPMVAALEGGNVHVLTVDRAVVEEVIWDVTSAHWALKVDKVASLHHSDNTLQLTLKDRSTAPLAQRKQNS